MSLIEDCRIHKAVWWARTGNSLEGLPTYADPVEVDCRWDLSDGQMRADIGERAQFSDTVYVDRRLSVGDLIRRGTLEEYSSLEGVESAQTPADFGALPVGTLQAIDTLDGDETLHIARTGIWVGGSK